jgi:hypothetical protein
VLECFSGIILKIIFKFKFASEVIYTNEKCHSGRTIYFVIFIDIKGKYSGSAPNTDHIKQNARIMKFLSLITLFFILMYQTVYSSSPKEIYQSARPTICLVSFYQNIASDSKIGSFDKIKKHRTGILVSPNGLVMVSNDIYPVSLDFASSGGSLLSGMPSDFQVKLSTGEEYPAHFLGKDDQAMVAFIKIHSVQDNLFPFIEFVPSQGIGMSDTVYTLELLAQNYNFSALFTTHQINSVIESPQRKFLVNNFSPALSAGGLVLNNHGRAIGAIVNQSFDFTFLQPGDFEDFHKNYLEIAAGKSIKSKILAGYPHAGAYSGAKRILECPPGRWNYYQSGLPKITCRKGQVENRRYYPGGK